MDEGLSEAVEEVFIRLYDEDLIYRGNRLVNWDPETTHRDFRSGSDLGRRKRLLLVLPLSAEQWCDTTADGKRYITIATTRPETMLGDTALAVHPEDERFKDHGWAKPCSCHCASGRYQSLPMTT